MNIKQIRTELATLAKSDQAMRNSGHWNIKIDRKNTRRLKAIVQKYGWPDKLFVGALAAKQAWLIVQHADHAVDFQEKCLKLMQSKMKLNRVEPSQVAYLTDRVRVNRGKKQLYGTQFYLNSSKQLVPRPIYDRKNLARRRGKVGLESFATNKKRLARTWQTFKKLPPSK